jgi:hypothetical protein
MAAMIEQGEGPSPVPPYYRDAAPPEGPAAAPGVWTWFIVYCVVMGLVYVGLAGMGCVYLLVDPRELEMDPVEARMIGSVFVALGATLLAPFAAAPFLPRRRWVWVYDLILIALGLTSCCTLPMSVPILIFWIQPPARRYFGWQ